jgi:hypothetical protein
LAERLARRKADGYLLADVTSSQSQLPVLQGNV